MVEVFGELLFGLVSIAVAFVVGSVVFVLVRYTRRTLHGFDAPVTAIDPDGGVWTVRVDLAPEPLRLWISQRAFRMRRQDRQRRISRGVEPDGVAPDELARPSRLFEAADEGAGIVAIALLAFVLLAILILIVEAFVLLLVAAVVLVVRWVLGRWTCEVVSPGGQRRHLPAGSLRRARIVRAQLAASVAAGRGVDVRGDPSPGFE